MKNSVRTQRHGAGFSIIGLLLVVVIIAILTGYYFSGDDESNPGITGYYQKSAEAAGTYPMVKARVLNVTAEVDLNTLDMSIQTWCNEHASEKPTLEKLRQAGLTVPNPPAGQHYEIDDTQHAILVKDQPMPGQGVPVPNTP
jgi:hypothetical protein